VGGPFKPGFGLSGASLQLDKVLPPLALQARIQKRSQMNWNKRIRQTHRWLPMAFTVAVIVNIVATFG